MAHQPLFALRILFCMGFLLLAIDTVVGQSVQDFCSKSTWANCGTAVKRELEKRPSRLRKNDGAT